MKHSKAYVTSRLVAVGVLFVGVVVVAAALGLYYVNNISASSNEVIDEVQPRTQLCGEVLIRELRANDACMDALISETAKEAKTAWDSGSDDDRRVRTLLATLEKGDSTGLLAETDPGRIKTIREIADEYGKLRTLGLGLYQAHAANIAKGRDDSETFERMEGVYDPMRDKLEEEIMDLGTVYQENGWLSIGALRSSQSMARLVLVAALVVAPVLTMAALAWAIVAANRPMDEAAKQMSRVLEGESVEMRPCGHRGIDSVLGPLQEALADARRNDTAHQAEVADARSALRVVSAEVAGRAAGLEGIRSRILENVALLERGQGQPNALALSHLGEAVGELEQEVARMRALNSRPELSERQPRPASQAAETDYSGMAKAG